MNPVAGAEATPRLVLLAETAADLMAPSPVSINAGTPTREAVAFFAGRGFRASGKNTCSVVNVGQRIHGFPLEER